MKFGKVGLVDPNVVKTNLFYKWKLKEMELGKSKLWFVLRDDFSSLTHTKNEVWGSAWIGLRGKTMKDSLNPKYGAT